MRKRVKISTFRIQWIATVGSLFFVSLFLGESFLDLMEIQADTIELTQGAEETEKEKEKEKENEEENIKIYSLASFSQVIMSEESAATHCPDRFMPTNLREIETPPPDLTV